jgi:hypothetical protein
MAAGTTTSAPAVTPNAPAAIPASVVIDQVPPTPAATVVAPAAPRLMPRRYNGARMRRQAPSSVGRMVISSTRTSATPSALWNGVDAVASRQTKTRSDVASLVPSVFSRCMANAGVAAVATSASSTASAVARKTRRTSIASVSEMRRRSQRARQSLRSLAWHGADVIRSLWHVSRQGHLPLRRSRQPLTAHR